MKRTIALVLTLLLALSLLAGCGGNTASETPPTATAAPSETKVPEDSGSRVLHDSYGDVTVEGEVSRVISTAPAYTVSVLLMGGVDKLVGIDANSAGNAWLLKMYPQLADLPVVTLNGELNMETVLTLDPDLIILTPAMKSQLEQVQALGVAVINEPVYDENATLLEQNRDRQSYYGVAMGGESLEIADTYKEYFNKLVDHVYDETESLADKDRPVVLEIRNIDPLTVCNGNDRSVAQDWITAAGGVNAAGDNTDEGTSGAWEVSVEQVLSWDPEYIVCSNSASKEALMSDGRFAQLTAVKAGNVVDMPKGLMAWGYNGPELPLFVEFAGKYIHPDLFTDVDVVADARAFYSKFFGINVSDEELQGILFTDLPLDRYTEETFGATPATRTVTDMSGVEVEIPWKVNTYVESWFAHNAVDLMLDQAEGMLITCANTSTHQWMYIVCPNFWNAASTTFSADMNLEEIIAAKPDVVFGSNNNYREMFNNVGIPFINCSYKDYDGLKQSILLTAEVLGGDALEIADRYVEYLDSRIAWVAERTGGIPEDQRTTVAHGSSVYELDFDGANTIIDEWIKLSGGINAAAQEVEGNLQTINIEQVMAWDPDVIITGRPQSQVDEIMSDPAWSQLSAVRNGRVYSNPRGVFAWDRYGVEAALQPQWCAQLLYPDLFEDFDVKAEVKTFYKDFFDYELSDEQVQMILDYVTPELDIENQRAA